ncbi:MAG TPA: protoporphyrinogen oxidase [Anaerolineae bacterium]
MHIVRSNSQHRHDWEVAVIGSGITGLAAAYRLRALVPGAEITLVERDAYPGGKIVTERTNGFIIEGGADSFLSRKPRGIGLCEELGIIDRLQGRDPQHHKTYVKRHGRLHRLPEGLTGMIPTNLEALAESALISPAGKARLAQEPELPPAPENGDESIASFVSRRLGREVYEQLVEPLMGGIYAGDGEQLSLAATFPQLRRLELKHGSLIEGLLASQQKEAPSAGYPPFVAFRSGMQELVDRLLARLPDVTILTGVGVRAVQPEGTGYRLVLDNGQVRTAGALILTTPAFVTAKLVAGIDPLLAEAHAAIPYASTATISLAYAESDLPQPLDGYGYVIPRVEDTDVLACTWTSSKWEGRAPKRYVLIRVYAGRYGRRDVLQGSDDELVALARTELKEMLDVKARPQFHRLYRWPRGMPQYTMGHLERLAQIESRLHENPGLFLAGAAYRGVGIPDCIHSGEEAARAAASRLSEKSKWVHG